MIGACYAYARNRANLATFNSGHVLDFTTAAYETSLPAFEMPNLLPNTNDG